MGTFRLIDLVTTIGIALAILGMTAAGRRQAQADVNIIGCAKNLQQIAQSLVMYESVFGGQFPRTRASTSAPLAAYTAPDAPAPFSEKGPAMNDVTASPFLLARTLDIPADVFLCPAALSHGFGEHGAFDRSTVKTRSNFRSRLNLNYSFANMYPDESAIAAGYSLDKFHDRLPVDFVLAADSNPGEAVTTATTQAGPDPLRSNNSPNHERDGENVLYADGSVHFMDSPYVGVKSDNVYGGRIDGTTAVMQPANAIDSVLLPIWTAGPQLTPHTTINRRWFLSISMAITFILIAAIVYRGVRRHPKPI